MRLIINCLLVVLLGGLLGGMLPGCALYSVPEDKRTVGTIVDDSVIVTDVKTAMLKQDAAEALDVNVFCYDGHVYLVGDPPYSFRPKAVAAARGVKGVQRVTTHWFIPGTGSGAEDTLVSTRLRSNLIAAPGLSSTRIDFEVYGGNVVLLGITGSDAQTAQAVRIARGTTGVKNVTSYLVP